MGLAIVAYLILAGTGVWMFRARMTHDRPSWLRSRSVRFAHSLHYMMGGSMVLLVLLLLGIGIVGTLGHFGSLGHSSHLQAGLAVVGLVLLSAGSATQISIEKPWMRSLHIGTNIILFVGFAWVSLTGWGVVQKYLP